MEGVLYREFGRDGFIIIGKLKPNDQSIEYHDYACKFDHLSSAKINKTKALSGHVYIDTLGHIFPKSKYLTLLREPLDRAISFYYYSLRNKDHTLTKFLIENSISLQEFLSLTEIDISSIDVPLYVKTELQLILFNGQTKFIAESI